MSTKNQSKYKMCHWLKLIVSFLKYFYSFGNPKALCFLMPFCFLPLACQRVCKKMLRLTKMQEGDLQKHIWEENIWSNKYVRSLQCWP